jgi:hypothetical protein
MTASADRAIKAEVELSAPESKAGRLQRACLALLKQHEREGTIPTNGRFLFYELEQQGVVPKAYRDASGKERARTPAQDISDATMRLRNVGPVPWDWILDESRDVTTWRYAGSVYEYVTDSVERARIDCWDGEPPPLIICEARATRGVLERTVAAEYLCPITATGGQCGGHIVNEIVPLLKNNERKVLYIGDCEERGPGDQIEANTRRYIEKHAKRTFTPETWIKVALTPEQVARSPRLRRLTARSIAATDRRAPTRRSSAKRSGRRSSRWSAYRYARNASGPRSAPRSPSWGVGDDDQKGREACELERCEPARGASWHRSTQSRRRAKMAT